MTRKEFGKLIMALRREHTDKDGKRWTQERLAEEILKVAEDGRKLASEDIIGNIERGEKGLLDGDDLMALASALQLTSGERKEFFLAASGVDNKNIARQGLDSEVVLSRLMRRLEEVRLPAYIMDSYCDIVAYNSAMPLLLELGEGGPSLARARKKLSGRNMLHFVFSEEAVDYYRTRMISLDWHRFAYQVMMIFRTSTLGYRPEEHFKKLLKELKEHPEFRRYWECAYYEQEDHIDDNEHIRLNSKWGNLVYFSTSFTTVTVDGELHFCVYVPASPKTAEKFAEIIEKAGNGAHRLADWPKKKELPDSGNASV